MLFGIALSEILKTVVTRVRPSEQLYDSLGYSYPSGHSMGAAALAVALAFIFSRAHMLRLAHVGAVPPLAIPSEDEDDPAPVSAGLDDSALTDDSGAAPTEIAPPLEPVRLRFHWSMVLACAWVLLMMWSQHCRCTGSPTRSPGHSSASRPRSWPTSCGPG
nr:phosphatase PAP2 family protein [Brevibacterium marinum]